MAEEIAFENGRISNYEGLVTLTLDRVILHIVVHHSSTSTYMPNFTEIKETFCGWRTYIKMDWHLRLNLLGRLRKVDLRRVLQFQMSLFHESECNPQAASSQRWCMMEWCKFNVRVHAASTAISTCSLMTTCDISAVSVKPLISWKPNCGCWWCVAGCAMATAGTGTDDAGIPAPTATAGVGIGICSGSSGCGVEPSFAGRLGADSCGSSLSSSDVSFRYEPGVRSYTYS